MILCVRRNFFEITTFPNKFFCPICQGAHINNQQSHFGTSAVTLQIGNTSIIETMGVLLTNYMPPSVPFFYWLGGVVRGSYSGTGGVRSDHCACSSGGEPFDLYPSRTSLPTSPLLAPEPLFYGVPICLTRMRFKREKWKSEKKVLHGSWCKIRRTYIASIVTYSKHDEYKDDDSG